MGTNYYVQTRPCENACEHCAQSSRIHLGKSSAGWKFLHRAYLEDDRYLLPDDAPIEVRDRESWLKLLELGSIVDEYDRTWDREELLQLIDAKQVNATMSHSNPEHMGPYWRPSANEFEADGYDFMAREFS